MTASLILASASAARQRMLGAAGLSVAAIPAAIDEADVKASLAGDGATVTDVAEALAELKARRVARLHPTALVIGADQMLECDGSWFDKPTDRAQARQQLIALRGRSHRLISSAVAVMDTARLWHHSDHATLRMRPFSDDFLDRYLDQVGDEVMTTVGGYRLEGLGVQLFDRVDGDIFTIMGLPLLPLLGYLRGRGDLPT
ncbi:MAG: Maf family protein [Inquilinaceae bacterium]